MPPKWRNGRVSGPWGAPIAPRSELCYPQCGCLVDLFPAIWGCLRVFSDAWTWGVTTTIRLDHTRSIYDHGRSHNGHIHLQTHPHPPHPQHTEVGGCGMKWGYAVVPEHPHTPWGMWGSLVHHCNAHTDRSRHISVDSDPHPHARMTHRTARRGWFVDVLRVIWWCLRVF